jgi:outer membrane receptor for ferrienterochelin and colicins
MPRSRASVHRGAAALALGAAAWVYTAPANADDAEDLAGLLAEPVVTGASKSAERSSDAPATTSVLTAADMRRYGIRTLAEAINFLGMGVVTEDPLRAVDIGSRGVVLTGDYGNHFLVVVDGHALNEPWGGSAYFEQGLGLPLELIDRVELVLGAGSVLYGGNAMLGVINIVTKKAGAFQGVTIVAEAGGSPEQGLGGTFTSFAPRDLGTTYRLGLGFGKSFALFGEDASFVAAAELYGQDGPSFDFPVQTGIVNSAGEPSNFGPRAPAPGAWGGRVYDQYYTRVPTIWGTFTIGDLSIQARATEYRRATPYVNYFNQLASDFDEERSFESERWFSLDVRYQKHLGDRVTLVAHGYGDSYRYEQFAYNSDPAQCGPVAPDPCYFVPRPRARWAGLEVQTNVDWLRDDALTTLVGADVRVREIRATLDFEVASTHQIVLSQPLGDVTEYPWAVYLQQRYSPIRRLNLNAGVRLDSDPIGGEHVSPRAAFAVEPWKNGVIKGIYAEAFRAPNGFESIYRPSEDASQGSPELPSLRPETVRSVEASVEQRFGSHRLLTGVYRTWWDDMISLALVDPETASLAYLNTSTINNYGFNSMFEGTAGPWAYGASLTGGYARRSTPDGTEKLPVAPQMFGNARASYDLPEAWPTLALASHFVSSRLADRANDGNFRVTPVAPFSLTLRATISGEVPPVAGLSYRLSFNYVTAAHSPYVAGPVQQQDPTDPDRPPATLAPVNRLLGFATLTYNLPL